MTANTLVIIEQVAAAIEDGAVAVDLDPEWVMRRVTMDDVGDACINETSGKALVLDWNAINPIRTLVS